MSRQTVYLFKNTILPMPHIYVSFTNTNKTQIEKLQKDLETLREWAVKNGMKINPGKCKAIRFMRAQVKNPLGYSLCDQKILEASSCKCLGIIIRSNLNCVDQVNYTAQKAWKALHFVMRVPKKMKQEYKMFSLHVTGMSCSCIWSCMLGSMQRRTDTCLRLSTNESCSIC